MTYSLRQRFKDRETFEALQLEVNEMRLRGEPVPAEIVQRCNKLARGSQRKWRSYVKRLGI